MRALLQAWVPGSRFRGSQFGQVFPLGSELASVGTEVPTHLSVPWSSEVLGTGCSDHTECQVFS